MLCGDVECGMWSVGGAVWGCRVWDVECGVCGDVECGIWRVGGVM